MLASAEEQTEGGNDPGERSAHVPPDSNAADGGDGNLGRKHKQDSGGDGLSQAALVPALREPARRPATLKSSSASGQ